MTKPLLCSLSTAAALILMQPSAFAQTAKPGPGASFSDLLAKTPGGAKGKPSEEDVRAALKPTIDYVNKAMPVTVDNITRADNITLSPTSAKFTYNFTLDLPLKQIQSEKLVTRIQPNLLKGVCTSPDMKLFLDRGVTIGYSYRAKDGAFAGRFEIAPADCR